MSWVTTRVQARRACAAHRCRRCASADLLAPARPPPSRAALCECTVHAARSVRTVHPFYHQRPPCAKLSLASEQSARCAVPRRHHHGQPRAHRLPDSAQAAPGRRDGARRHGTPGRLSRLSSGGPASSRSRAPGRSAHGLIQRRYPHDAAARYARGPDYESWRDHLPSVRLSWPTCARSRPSARRSRRAFRACTFSSTTPRRRSRDAPWRRRGAARGTGGGCRRTIDAAA